MCRQFESEIADSTRDLHGECGPRLIHIQKGVGQAQCAQRIIQSGARRRLHEFTWQLIDRSCIYAASLHLHGEVRNQTDARRGGRRIQNVRQSLQRFRRSQLWDWEISRLQTQSSRTTILITNGTCVPPARLAASSWITSFLADPACGDLFPKLELI